MPSEIFNELSKWFEFLSKLPKTVLVIIIILLLIVIFLLYRYYNKKLTDEQQERAVLSQEIFNIKAENVNNGSLAIFPENIPSSISAYQFCYSAKIIINTDSDNLQTGEYGLRFLSPDTFQFVVNQTTVLTPSTFAGQRRIEINDTLLQRSDKFIYIELYIYTTVQSQPFLIEFVSSQIVIKKQISII